MASISSVFTLSISQPPSKLNNSPTTLDVTKKIILIASAVFLIIGVLNFSMPLILTGIGLAATKVIISFISNFISNSSLLAKFKMVDRCLLIGDVEAAKEIANGIQDQDIKKLFLIDIELRSPSTSSRIKLYAKYLLNRKVEAAKKIANEILDQEFKLSVLGLIEKFKSDELEDLDSPNKFTFC